MIEDGQYPRAGQADGGHPVYELYVSDFLQPLDPPPCYDLESINPDDYFITSGDAIQKTKFLSDVLWKYAGVVRHQLHDMKRQTKAAKEFERKCWEQAGSVRRMMNILIKIKGDDVFLETEWDQTHLICIKKNPRSKIKLKSAEKAK